MRREILKTYHKLSTNIPFILCLKLSFFIHSDIKFFKFLYSVNAAICNSPLNHMYILGSIFSTAGLNEQGLCYQLEAHYADDADHVIILS